MIRKIKNLLSVIEGGNNYEDLLEETLSLLDNNFSSEKLIEIIKLDISDILPFSLKKRLYEMLISKEPKATYLKEFAYWLQLNGGIDWDDYSNELLKKATVIEAAI